MRRILKNDASQKMSRAVTYSGKFEKIVREISHSRDCQKSLFRKKGHGLWLASEK